MEESTIYDSVFKTIMQKMPRLVVPLVNEAFGRSYPNDVPVEPLPTEYESVFGRLTADSAVRIGDRIYHIECQASSDPRMPVRMLEYDFAIAMALADPKGTPAEIEFPDSCVVYLREADRHPNARRVKLVFPEGPAVDFMYKTLGVQSYAPSELFERGLLALLPFYLMRYEKEFHDIAADEEREKSLLDELSEMRADLEAAALESDDAGLYNEIVSLSTRVSDHLLRKEGALQKEARSAMGGEVLLLLSEEKELAVKEGREEGFKQGREEDLKRGREEGLEKGLEEGLERGRAEALIELVIAGHIAPSVAADSLCITESEVEGMVAAARQRQ